MLVYQQLYHPDYCTQKWRLWLCSKQVEIFTLEYDSSGYWGVNASHNLNTVSFWSQDGIKILD